MASDSLCHHFFRLRQSCEARLRMLCSESSLNGASPEIMFNSDPSSIFRGSAAGSERVVSAMPVNSIAADSAAAVSGTSRPAAAAAMPAITRKNMHFDKKDFLDMLAPSI